LCGSYYENLPYNCEIATLAQISYFERGITFPASAKELILNEANIPCIRTANVQDEFEIDDLIYVDRKYIKSNKNKLLQKGDIIMSSANSKELVGKTCIVKELKAEMTFGGFVIAIRGIVVNRKYLHLCLRDLFNKGAFIKESTQTTNIANVNTETLTSMQIPIPSLYEQNRIVDAVEVLFEKLSEIEKSLS